MPIAEEVIMTIESASKEQYFYIAVILYESTSDVLSYQPLYQEGFILIKTNSLDSAKEKASAYAKGEEVSYKNEDEETIKWSVKQIVDVNSVLYDQIEDDTELYARHFHNYKAYQQLDYGYSGG